MSTNVSLTPELEEYAKSKVAEGFYGSVSEVMRDALRLHRQRDVEFSSYIRKELSTAEDDINEGKVSPYIMDEMLDEFEAEFAIGKASNGG